MASTTFMVLGDSSCGPIRTISIESTLKGGNCRSCSRPLQIGEPRVKIAYPNVFVHYFSRSGTPSFYMHPECYHTKPVDFCRIGSCAFKETLPIKGFAINPGTEVIGYDKYPAQKECFQHSYELYLESLDQVQELIITSEGRIPYNPVADLQATSNENCAKDTAKAADTTMDRLPELSSIGTSSVLSVPVISASQPVPSWLDKRKSNLKRPRALESWEISVSYDADDEDRERLRQESCKPSDHEIVNSKEMGQEGKTATDESKPKVLTGGCITCGCHISPAIPQRQWASPHDAAEILGISSAILRSLAEQRAIPLFKRPSGQRVYNLPAIRAYIAKIRYIQLLKFLAPIGFFAILCAKKYGESVLNRSSHFPLDSFASQDASYPASYPAQNLMLVLVAMTGASINV